MFDGQTLNGWSVQEGPASAFRVMDGAIVVDQGANFPTWLRSDRQYENFDFRGEFFIKGWMNSGIYLHAPEHGRNTWVGMKINIFHQNDKEPRPESVGSIFPIVPPQAVNIRNQGEWNSFRALMDWPRLQVWMNDTLVQDLDVESVPELRHRLRRGYLGLRVAFLSDPFSEPARCASCRRRRPGRCSTMAPRTSRSGRSRQARRRSSRAAPILRGDGNGQLATHPDLS